MEITQEMIDTANKQNIRNAVRLYDSTYRYVGNLLALDFVEMFIRDRFPIDEFTSVYEEVYGQIIRLTNDDE